MGSLRSLQNLLLLCLRDYQLLLVPLLTLRAAPEQYDPDKWDREYAQGNWSFLNDLAEAAHYHVIASYVRALKPNARILDVGCGEGHLPPILHGYAAYLGIDISKAAITSASKHADAKTAFQLASAESFTQARAFDAIILNESLYYLKDPTRSLRHLHTLLAPGGILIVSMALCGLRDALRKLHIWRSVYRLHATIDETSLFTRDGPTWIIAALKPRD